MAQNIIRVAVEQEWAEVFCEQISQIYGGINPLKV